MNPFIIEASTTTEAIDVLSTNTSVELNVYEKSAGPTFSRPDWQTPRTWELTLAGTLKPGDAVRLGGYTYLIIKRMRWRQKIANILVHLVGDATKYKRIGSIDYVPAFRNYVRHQNDDRNGLDHTAVGRELTKAENGAWTPPASRWFMEGDYE